MKEYKEKKTTYTPARKKAIDKYAGAHDRIYLTVSKDKKAEYEKIASIEGKSLTKFIIDTVDEKIKKKH